MRVTIKTDMSDMTRGLRAIVDQHKQLPAGARDAFADRYRALTKAGAEWFECDTHGDVMCAKVGDDMRRLCAEFGITV